MEDDRFSCDYWRFYPRIGREWQFYIKAVLAIAFLVLSGLVKQAVRTDPGIH